MNDSDADSALRFYLVSVDAAFPGNGQIGLQFDWWLPFGNTTHYTLEEATPGVDFHPVATLNEAATSIPRRSVFTLGPNDRAGDYQFRLRAGTDGRPSKSVAYTRSVLPGTLEVVQSAVGFDLSYDAPLQLPDQITITRTIRRVDGSSSAPAVVFTTTSRSGTFSDTDLSGFVDGATYEYALVVTSGGLNSDAVTAATGIAGSALPQFVSVQQTGLAVHLTFRSNSLVPGTLRLHRETIGGPPTVSNFGPFNTAGKGEVLAADDTLPADAGVHVYQLFFTGAGEPESTPVIAHVQVAPPGWSGTLVALPPPVETARASDGRFAFLVDDPAQKARLIIPPGGDPTSGALVPATYHPNRLLLDANDHPHAVFQSGDTLVHVSHDGTAWSTETLGVFSLSQPADVTVGLDGDLWAAWVTTDSSIWVAHKIGSAWQVEQLPAGLTATAPVIVAADENSLPHLAGADAVNPRHLFRDAAGWHSEAVPLPFNAFVASHVPSYMVASSTQVTMVDRTHDSSFPLEDDPGIVFNQRTAAGWAHDQTGVQATVLSSDFATIHAVIAPDQSTVLWSGFDGAVEKWNGPGAFQSRTLFPIRFQETPFALGFHPSGSIWTLFYFRSSDGKFPQGENAVLYEQLPPG